MQHLVYILCKKNSIGAIFFYNFLNFGTLGIILVLVCNFWSKSAICSTIVQILLQLGNFIFKCAIVFYNFEILAYILWEMAQLVKLFYHFLNFDLHPIKNILIDTNFVISVQAIFFTIVQFFAYILCKNYLNWCMYSNFDSSVQILV